MTANWFEAKVKYMKVNEDGREKKVNEAYLLDAMSYTEAESRIMHEMESVISGDYYISSLKKSNITELVPSEDENDDRWYKAKVNIIDADEVSGKEKSTGQYYLVAASNINKALENLEKSGGAAAGRGKRDPFRKRCPVGEGVLLHGQKRD